MADKTCPGCGKRGFRKGSTVTLQDPAVGPGGRRARVCGDCHRRALVVVAPLRAQQEKPPTDLPVEAIDVEAIELRHALIHVQRQLRLHAKMARHTATQRARDGAASAAVVEHQIGRAEGYESAFEILRDRLAKAHMP